MNLLVSQDCHFLRAPDGSAWTVGPLTYPFWARYLDAFETVRVVARAKTIDQVPDAAQRVDGDSVALAPLPDYQGPWQYLRQARRVRRDIEAALGARDAVILSAGHQVSAPLFAAVLRESRPFGVEVGGDPYDIFAPGVVRHPLRPFFRWWLTRQVRKQCEVACAVKYVTAQTLQRRYPPAPRAAVTHFSNPELGDECFVATPRRDVRSSGPFTLVSVGALEQLYKAPDVLIEAVARCVREGLAVEAIWVGGGRHRDALQARAAAAGVGDRVRFVGELQAGEAVRAQLDRADLFVLPSRTEGLPRALLEAMARALPCIGSTAGGIPELLAPDDLVPPGDAAALARKIREVLADPERRAGMSARNLGRAHQYDREAMRGRGIRFYRHVREETERWLATRN